MITFWHPVKQTKHHKKVQHLKAITAASDKCVLVTKKLQEDISELMKMQRSVLNVQKSRQQVSTFNLTLCDAIGSTLDARQVHIEPIHVAMTTTLVIIANDQQVFLWQINKTVRKLLKSNLANYTLIR